MRYPSLELTLMEFVAIPLYSPLGCAAVHLEVVGLLDHKHVAMGGSDSHISKH